jgi:uncharacterized membrane protein YfcA
MTPILVLLFRVQPLAAVSSDLVASLVMKPFGGAVHLTRGTVHRRMVLFLMLGSVPAAFAGVLLIRVLSRGHQLQSVVQVALGAALILAAAAVALKLIITLVQLARGYQQSPLDARDVRVRPVPTILVGALGGLLVGMTSVGSGSVIIVLLLYLYPRLKTSQLVGTDLVQAVPLVGAAALSHLLFGDFKLGLTLSLIIGGVPGVLMGARISSSASSRWLRPAIAVVLLASGLKLVQVGNLQLGIILLGVLLLMPVAGRLVRNFTPAPAPVPIPQEAA